MKDEDKRKNILDLCYQKYLNLASTSIIIAFTYLIGVGIAIVTKQIKLENFVSMIILFSISAGVLGICTISFYKALFHLKNIPKVLKEI